MSEPINEPINDLVDYTACTPDQREQVLDALMARTSALHAEALRVIAAAETERDHEADGALSMGDWLVERYQASPVTARRWVRAGRVLETLPHLQAAYATGRVGFDALTHIVAFATPATDARLAELAASSSYAGAEAMAKQQRRISTAERDDTRRRSHLRLVPDRSGLGARVSGFLPTEDAAYVRNALDRRAEAAGPDPDTGIWAPHDTRLAHALVDVCAHDLAQVAAHGADADASLVVIHTPDTAVRRGTTTAGSATIDGDPIDDDALQRLLCDTKVEFNLDDPQGRTVGIGRAGRTIPRWLRRRVTHRDHGCCRWPGCHRPIRHLHHLHWWTRGGPTNASNLIGVCWHHHHLLHEGGWHTTGNADTHITFTSPTGRTLHARAGPTAA